MTTFTPNLETKTTKPTKTMNPSIVPATQQRISTPLPEAYTESLQPLPSLDVHARQAVALCRADSQTIDAEEAFDLRLDMFEFCERLCYGCKEIADPDAGLVIFDYGEEKFYFIRGTNSGEIA